MTRTVYKALRHGKSPYQGFAWPLPKGKRPGKWLELTGEPVLCQRGFHGYIRLEDAEKAGPEVYAMEVDGEIVEDHEKVSAQRARLIRRVNEFEAQGPIDRGILPCKTCHKPHDSYIRQRGFAPSWASPDDGHTYNHIGWEDLLRSLPTPAVLEITGTVERSARKSYKGPGTYSPVVPAFHGPFKPWADEPERCGTCGLGPEHHSDWAGRVALADEFNSADRWELLLVIQQMRLAGTEPIVAS